MWLDDLKTILTAAGVTVTGLSTVKTIPEGDGPYLIIIETTGSGGDYIQNQVLPATEYPSAQILVVAKSYQAARSTAESAYRALLAVRNQTVTGTLYKRIRALNRPFDKGPEETTRRAKVAFNVLGEFAGT